MGYMSEHKCWQYSPRWDIATGHRTALCESSFTGHYRIGYLINGNIDILGVFHGSLDITKYQL